MKELKFIYQTSIEEKYIDQICSQRQYQETIKDENGSDIPNPQDKWSFVAEQFKNEIDRNVVYKQFFAISEGQVAQATHGLLSAAAQRIDAKIEQVRTVIVEITDAPNP